METETIIMGNTQRSTIRVRSKKEQTINDMSMSDTISVEDATQEFGTIARTLNDKARARFLIQVKALASTYLDNDAFLNK